MSLNRLFFFDVTPYFENSYNPIKTLGILRVRKTKTTNPTILANWMSALLRALNVGLKLCYNIEEKTLVYKPPTKFNEHFHFIFCSLKVFNTKAKYTPWNLIWCLQLFKSQKENNLFSYSFHKLFVLTKAFNILHLTCLTCFLIHTA